MYDNATLARALIITRYKRKIFNIPIMETERQAIEREVFNQLVHEKWDKKSLVVNRVQPPFSDYNGDLFDGAKKLMGNLSGKTILEIGCGSGELSVWFALQGAQVIGIDVSDESILIAKRRAEENEVAERTRLVACPAEKMPFEDRSIDVIFINVSLHHLEIDQALAECKRILKPGGRFIAVEPLVFSETVQKIRASKLVTSLYPIRQETPTERILTVKDLEYIKTIFKNTQIIPYRIFSPFIFKAKPIFHLLSRRFTGADWEMKKRACNRYFQDFDATLISHLPFFKYFSRYIVIACEKE